ncbi:type 1 glutamine amidotransferase [Companilactobacillus sp.]|jgi:CobQ-like glutamine amidotransferase family enzyme|uniref:type 1 glutamine amidotransferase n=1 Tax=Companilactobacillus sp. TaxID=2767905 RepID=UPI0025B924B8|nr:cobalamin biosynthesis protein CobQ [Companilactobacillus sp.]MCH4009346.1 cobalamin biosynthesis protein CobQ [Companilactobacillus sp.]MCH4050475.1 cobalamin biosynthesis protein CobQ [Companilactobacillus sp.]MCH4077288.1 cobalamin biosynthesis protein CobQ [Companilactobacillus sp.]MCH4125864.1 cobalamin biosynthesis protein CobQ [Companilactobacillus sp.]MCI1311573.1 cobalamin biosynthesis protein CobQ [Companilactobacillus sp.]
MSDTIKIAYLYEDLMNTYGDSGDVKILSFLLKEQGYDTQVDNVSLDDEFNAFDYDFLFFGGGQDFEQTVVAKDLIRHRETIKDYIEAGKPMLCICGGYQFLGKYYQTVGGETIKCLNILPFHTVFKADSRMIGDTEYETEWGTVRAFENHSGRTYFDDKNKLKPLGKMIEGYGNNPEDKAEGMRYKNTIGSYSHGPILKNENIARSIAQEIIKSHQEKMSKPK